MKIGLSYTARSLADGRPTAAAVDDGADDAEEEFDSPETIAAIAAALAALGHEVELLGDGPPLAERLLSGPVPDFVFNIAEGRGAGRCREARTPALLEMFGIAYSGSDPLTLAATLDKNCAKRLVREAGGSVPRGILVDKPVANCLASFEALAGPLIVKPAFEGSSKGIRSANLVEQRDKLPAIIGASCARYGQPALVEEFIDGEELTVGILGNDAPQVLGILRVIPRDVAGPFVYSLEVKRDWRRRVRYEVPAQLAPADEAAVRQAALLAYRALGCRDVARIDFRLRAGVPYFLEANPLPGLTPGSSDLVLLAEGVGIDYRQLIERILQAALRRTLAAEGSQRNPAHAGSALVQAAAEWCPISKG